MRAVLTALAARHRPVLRWEDADGASLELTGPVLANWVHKAHGLLSDLDAGPHRELGIVSAPETPLHWRALAGALAAWSLGAPVHVVDEAPPAGDWLALTPEERAEDPVTDSADEVLVFPTAPLALAADAPPETIDFATALRAFPDDAPLTATPDVSFGDAATTQTVRLADLLPQDAAPGTPAEAAPAAEVVLMTAPRTAEDWAHVFAGLLQGLLVLRPRA